LKEDASFGSFGPIPIVKGDCFTEKQGLDTLIKKKEKISSYIRKFRMDQGRASLYMRKCVNI
jgi:hypothetical protein